MGVLRTISCPACGEAKVTKAGEGTRISCASCGVTFRAPAAVSEATVDPPAPPVEKPPVVEPTPPKKAAPRGVTVRRADGVTVNRAKPRPAKKDPDTARAGGGEPSGVEPSTPARKVPAATKKRRPPAAPASTVVPSGRGGVGFYRDRVRRAG